MPERYTISIPAEELAQELGVEIPEEYQPRYNAAPAQLLPVITSEAQQGLSFFYWGTIPGWSGNKALSHKIINIHKENLVSKTANQRLLLTQRCLIPSDGFYIWKQLGKKTRIPYRFELSSKSIFVFPGIWEEFEDENDQLHHTFKIIVRDPDPSVEGFSDTMPVILNAKESINWLDKTNDLPTLVDTLNIPLPPLTHYTVSSRIDRLDIDNPDLIKSVESMNQFGNYSLFD